MAVRKDYLCDKCGKFEADGDITACPKCGSQIQKIFIKAVRFGHYRYSTKLVEKSLEEQGYKNFNMNPSTFHASDNKTEAQKDRDIRYNELVGEIDKLKAQLNAKDKESIQKELDNGLLMPRWNSNKHIDKGQGYAAANRAIENGLPAVIPDNKIVPLVKSSLGA